MLARSLVPALLLALAVPALGQENLLRNGDFQDDWQTLLPQLKNHHWNYTTEVPNRRDFNPDGWQLSGNWQWQGADKPRGQRRLVLASPARVVQSVNWVTINNSAKLAGWPDAGGFPIAEAMRSKQPLALVRDLTFRVRLSGKDVPKGAVTLTVAWSALSPIDDPAASKRIVSASAAVPEGTFAATTVEVKLPAATWLEAAKKDPAFAAQGALMPMAATCEIAYADKQAGSLEVLEAALAEPGPAAPNLLPHGGFEEVKGGRAVGWSAPEKYRYFPPGIYYIFNTWHNSNSANRAATAPTALLPHTGKYALQMNLPPGDEVCVVSDPVKLQQKEARLIEVRAWLKTDQVAMLQIDAEDEQGRRLDGFNFIHKAILSIGTDDWRLVRQVFRPASPLQSIRLKLCGRGMNGYTLDGTGQQPQQNAAGVVWWDDVQLFEPESTAAELEARGVKAPVPQQGKAGPHLARLELGERLLGDNELTAEIVNPQADGTFLLELELPGARGSSFFRSDPVRVLAGQRQAVRLTYRLEETGQPYGDTVMHLRLRDMAATEAVASTTLPLAVWTVPMDLRLGALYLQPNQKQFIRVNLGLSHVAMARLKELRLDVVRLGSGQVLKTFTVPATPDAIAKQRAKIPDGLRGDFRNLLLTDLDVSFLPVAQFDDPQRNWVVRASTVDADGKTAWTVTSPAFCRLARDGPQLAIQSVGINERGELLVNDRPWMPWGVAYGHNPVYDGPAQSGQYHDLTRLKPWSLYDRHGGNLTERALWDLNCVRHVEGAQVTPAQLEQLWKKGLYASTVFLKPPAAGKPWPADYLQYLRTAPMVVAVSRGPEEAFGYFLPMTDAQLAQVKAEVEELRRATGKPVMVGHGGYWTRLEFERAPFFDIYDPETEPWYPAPVHTDLAPLVAGKAKVMWLRPQMYESVPYQRWRYHTYVELIRGVRGWQIAHGPGDASTFRGLHAELTHLQPALYSQEKAPAVRIEPPLEHLVRKAGNKVLIVAATTHGLSFGDWRWTDEQSPAGRARVTADPFVFRDESDGYHATGEPPARNLCPHGIQYLTDPRSWPAGSKLVTWAKLDAAAPPKNLVALVKADGRWTHAGHWGAFDTATLRKDNDLGYWFLRTFYRHARGFLGWGDKVPAEALDLLPAGSAALGALPKAGDWVKLDVPLDKVGAAGKLLDGVGFLHDGGRVWWTHTVLVAPEGKETVVFGDREDRPDPALLAKTKIAVQGLKKGTVIRVLFEDRTVVAEDGYFVDDFRGVDLYQRYGGERTGYGDSPVALHLYEVPLP
jgi:hypothetical protein